jgi:hypothetical protein
MRHRSALLLVPLLATSCVVGHFEYTPPPESTEVPEHERVVGVSFDRTWSALISVVSSDFFGIENFEKESGLMTLSFSVSPLSTAIESGHLSHTFNNMFGATLRDTPGTQPSYEGPYVDYLQIYNGAQLTGRANLVVREVPDSEPPQTAITVNLRFVVQANTVSFSFNSGQRLVQEVANPEGGDPTRVMQSTGYVEGKILDAIDALFGVDDD